MSNLVAIRIHFSFEVLHLSISFIFRIFKNELTGLKKNVCSHDNSFPFFSVFLNMHFMLLALPRMLSHELCACEKTNLS